MANFRQRYSIFTWKKLAFQQRFGFASFWLCFYFLLCCYHQEPPIRKSSVAWVRGICSYRCWVLGGNLGGNQHADEAKNGVGSNAILRTTDIAAFF